jgi:1-deoxy-D-xylulose-5-phosphate synthase
LNHAGVSNSDILIVLNDNCMSIDPNVGALREYLTDISTSQLYNKMKDDIWNMLGKLSKFGKTARELVSNVEQGLKTTFFNQSNLFESLNLRYFGPIDGHDINHLVRVMEDLREIPGPKILHVLTVKGKGFKPSEEGDPTIWHAPGVRFDKITGELYKTTNPVPQPPKYQDVFGHTIIELAKQNDKIMGITPAMPSGCSLKYMMKEMPDRAFDVGIAEQHAVTFSAGLATQGLRPFCNIYSTFLQRGYDQLIHDVALQKLPVVFCIDRGGLAGADGPTHHGTFDLAFLRVIPNMIVSAPMDEIELRNLMFTAQLEKINQPFSIRYPRGQGVHADWLKEMEEIKPGTGRIIKKGRDIAILTIGHPGNFAVEACKILQSDDLDPAHYDMRFVKPLDETLLHKVFNKFKKIITVEDGCLQGGFGSAILEFATDHGYKTGIKRLGVPDRFIEHGAQPELWHECGYDTRAIVDAARSLMGVSVKVNPK